MKKMIATYVIQAVFLGTFIFVSVRLLRLLESIDTELTLMRYDQSHPEQEPFASFARPMRVEVVNTPKVEIDEPLSVNVDNEPVVHVSP